MVLDIVLIVIGVICLLAGLIGSILPALPGPPLSYAGLLLLHFTERVEFTITQHIIWLVLVLLTVLADYLLPVLGVKRWNGSKWGNIGCIIGTIAGMFILPPLGLIFCPFLGAVSGEMLFAGKKAPEAFKAGFGAFIGFLLGTIFKLSVCGWFVFCFVKALIFN